jgi:peptidoglycan/xylan/chitin deacetylase (PgdA/CDA1 family)
MSGVQSRLFRAGLSALWYSGTARMLEPLTGGAGTILMMHRVQPASAHGAFAPNAALSITPEYLDALLTRLARDRIDVVTLDEAVRRIEQGGRKFVCFTCDDGYLDNLEFALPIFRRHSAPFTVYVTTGFIDRTMPVWWLVLEAIVAQRERIRVRRDDRMSEIAAADVAAKYLAFNAIAPEMFAKTVRELREAVAQLAADNDIDAAAVSGREFCTWDQLRAMHASGGVEIGCHTVNHPVLVNESEEDARVELTESRVTLEQRLGVAIRHFAYPYGKAEQAGAREFFLAREAGFASATTTRKANVFPAHRAHLHALPRVEVSPNFSGSTHYLRTFLSGAPLLAWNRGRRVVTL